jgi:hypothetical protein
MNCLLGGAVCAQDKKPEKKHYRLYAGVIGRVEVQLADGGQFQAEKGDVFPVVMFKAEGTKAVLQLAGTTFLLSRDWLELIEDKDLTEAQLNSYRRNAEAYLDWRATQAKAGLDGRK